MSSSKFEQTIEELKKVYDDADNSDKESLCNQLNSLIQNHKEKKRGKKRRRRFA